MLAAQLVLLTLNLAAIPLCLFFARRDRERGKPVGLDLTLAGLCAVASALLILG